MSTTPDDKRKRPMWKRTSLSMPYRLQPRDIKMIEAVFRYRFLTPRHLAALVGGYLPHLKQRLRLLFQDGYLDRPQAQRPTRILTEELVYALGKKGAELLTHLAQKPDAQKFLLNPSIPLSVSETEWNEVPSRQVTLPFIDHQLGVAEVLICLEGALTQRDLAIRWHGQFRRREHDRLVVGKAAQMPDAHFLLVDPTHERPRGIRCFLEYDRGTLNLPRMRKRFELYHRYWLNHRGDLAFRVITMAETENRMNSLRKIARGVGRTSDHPKTWGGLWFSHRGLYKLEKPETILEPIWFHAESNEPVSLLAGR